MHRKEQTTGFCVVGGGLPGFCVAVIAAKRGIYILVRTSVLRMFLPYIYPKTNDNEIKCKKIYFFLRYLLTFFVLYVKINRGGTFASYRWKQTRLKAA